MTVFFFLIWNIMFLIWSIPLKKNATKIDDKSNHDEVCDLSIW